MEKYRESEYQERYNEIMEVYNKQIKPLKNPFLIAFIVISVIVGIAVFIVYSYAIFTSGPHVSYNMYLKIEMCDGLAFICSLIPGTYFIRLRQVKRHRDRRIENLEAKKTEALSSGIYDANS